MFSGTLADTVGMDQALKEEHGRCYCGCWLLDHEEAGDLERCEAHGVHMMIHESWDKSR